MIALKIDGMMIALDAKTVIQAALIVKALVRLIVMDVLKDIWP